ncbi:MAG: hypothetical protein EA376_01425 [Phycisphaeraceae bacterium]|nr:MAG: hypothetical protein EA376_01425 [Phycisphaeraceae bacterium]
MKRQRETNNSRGAAMSEQTGKNSAALKRNIIHDIVGFAVGVVTTLAMLGRRRAGEKVSK